MKNHDLIHWPLRDQVQAITRNDIEALLDNELSWEEEKHARASLESDRTLKKYFYELRKQKTLLKAWAQHRAEGTLAFVSH